MNVLFSEILKRDRAVDFFIMFTMFSFIILLFLGANAVIQEFKKKVEKDSSSTST